MNPETLAGYVEEVRELLGFGVLEDPAYAETVARRWHVLKPNLAAGLLSPSDVGVMLAPELGMSWAAANWNEVRGEGIPSDSPWISRVLTVLTVAAQEYARDPKRLDRDFNDLMKRNGVSVVV